MKKYFRKLSWLLIVSMLIGLFTAGVAAADAQADETKNVVSVNWKDGVPESVTEIRLDVYTGKKQITEADKPIVITQKNGKWSADITVLPLVDANGKEIEYTFTFAKGSAEAFSAYEVKLEKNKSGEQILTISKKIVQNTASATVSAETTAAVPAPTAEPVTNAASVTAPAVSAAPEAAPEASVEKTVVPETETGITAGADASSASLMVADSATDSDSESGGASGSEADDNSSGGASGSEADDNSSGDASGSDADDASDNAAGDGTDAGDTSGDGAGEQTNNMSVTVKAVWADAEDQDGIRPEKMMVYLGNGENTTDPVALNADNDWTYTFEGLKEDEWNAYLAEDISGYSCKAVTGQDGVITMTASHTPEKRSYTVTVNWVDGDDALGKRPDSVKVQLYKIVDNKRVNVGSAVSLKADSKGVWSYTYSDLDKYYAGEALVYKFELLTDLDGYTATCVYSKGTLKLENDYQDTAAIDLKIQAKWVDNNDKYDKRPTSITVNVYAGKTKYKTVTLKADSKGVWSTTLTDLPLYKNGEKITYTVTTSVSNYVSKIAYTTKDGVMTATVTNTYKDIPLTGDSDRTVLWGILAMFAACGFGLVMTRKNYFMNK